MEHIKNEVKEAMGLTVVVHTKLKTLLYGLDTMKKNGAGRKSYFKGVSAGLTADINTLTLKVNLVNEKLFKHDFV